MSKGLGRIAHFDPRSMQFRTRDYLRPKLEGEALPADRILERGITLDQGNEGACVGFGWTGWENCKPKGYARQQGNDYGFDWYHEAQLHDPWPGTNYEGTATSAGAKVAILRGLAKAYLFASTVEDVEAFILANEGPVVMGTNWYRSMDRMPASYFLTVDPNSGVRGGHCWLLYGVTDRGATFVCQNSWGDSYGDEGTFYLTRDSLAALLYNHGDAISCVQTGVPPR